jgi:hypothetical protein
MLKIRIYAVQYEDEVQEKTVSGGNPCILPEESPDE